MTKVGITVAGHNVIVEADEQLDVVAAKALELFRATADPSSVKGYSATGFTAERASTTEYMPEHDATLHQRRHTQ